MDQYYNEYKERVLVEIRKRKDYPWGFARKYVYGPAPGKTIEATKYLANIIANERNCSIEEVAIIWAERRLDTEWSQTRERSLIQINDPFYIDCIRANMVRIKLFI